MNVEAMREAARHHIGSPFVSLEVGHYDPGGYLWPDGSEQGQTIEVLIGIKPPKDRAAYGFMFGLTRKLVEAGDLGDVFPVIRPFDAGSVP